MRRTRHWKTDAYSTVLWKRLNTESDPKKTETSTKWIFLRRFLFFQKLLEIPQIQFLEKFPVFIDPFRWFLGCIPVDQGLILLRDFPIFLIRFWFSKKFQTLSLLISFFFLGPFPHFLGLFPVFKKVLNSQFLVTKTDPKKEEMDPQKEETDQQTEDLKLFWKPETDPKKGNWPKKNGKRIKCKYSGNRPKIFGNPSTLFSLRGISDNFWKKKETDTNSLLDLILCWGVSLAP